MNAMPPFVRVLIGICLGLPGYLIATAGSVCSIIAIGIFVSQPEWVQIRSLLVILAAMLSIVIGFLMVVSAELLTGARHYRIPRNRIPVIIGYEIAVMSLCILSGGILFGVIASIRHQFPWGWMLCLLVLIAGLAATRRSRRLKFQSWNEMDASSSEDSLHRLRPTDEA